MFNLKPDKCNRKPIATVALNNRSYMKYFLSVVCFVVAHWVVAQGNDFDFDKAWEEVYKAELQYLPKSADQKADSIYQAAVRLNRPEHQVRALVHQAKYALLIEEEAHQGLVNRFETAIEGAEQPVKNILQNQLAGFVLDIYQKDRWRIAERTQLAEPSDDMNTWDKGRFLTEIYDLYLNSLNLDQSLLKTPISEYADLLKTNDETRKYRPLLIDLLAHNALSYFTSNDMLRARPAQMFMMTEPVVFSVTKEFGELNLQHADSASYHLQALKVFQQLHHIHTPDETPWALANLSLERLKFVKANAVLSESEYLYIQALGTLSKQLQGHEASIMVDLARAEAVSDLGSQYRPLANPKNQFKKAEALAICDSIIAAFPKAAETSKVRGFRTNILQPHAEIRMENFSLPNEPTKMLITYTNLDQLYVQTHHITPEDYDKYQRLSSDDDRNAYLADVEKVEEWKVKLTNEKDYQQHQIEGLFPAHPLGVYLVSIYADAGHTRHLAQELMQITNLSIVKTHDPNQHRYQVVDRKNGRSVPGVNVRFHSNNNYGRNINKRFVTDESGRLSFNNSDWVSSVNISLSKGNDSIRISGNHLGSGRPRKQEDDKYSLTAALFTDRAIYRPGQELYFKGILFKKDKRTSEVAANETLTVTLYDPNGQDLWYDYFTTNEFGSIAGTVKLPKSGLTGRYFLKLEPEDKSSELIINSDNGLEITKSFNVEEYKRPKFEVTFPAIKGVYRFGDSVNVNGQAMALAGSNLTNAKVAYVVKRKVLQGYYRPYSRRISRAEETMVEGETRTNAAGEFVVSFKALAAPEQERDSLSKASYEVEVSITDINGETRTGNTNLQVAHNPYSISLLTNELYNKETDSMRFQVQIKTLNGASKAMGGQFKIEKLKAPSKVKREAPWVKPDYQGFTEEEHNRLFPHWPYGDEMNKGNWPVSSQKYQSNILTGEEADIKVGNFKNWPSGYYRATFSTRTEFGDSLVSSSIFLLREANPNQLPDQARIETWLDKSTYQAGDTATLTLGSAAKLTLHYTIARPRQVEEHEITLNDEVKQVKIPILEGDEEGLYVFFYYVSQNDLQLGQARVKVLKTWPKIIIETGTFRDKLRPGNPERWMFRVKGEDGEKASAEILASMYDASLDQFASNDWAFDPIYRPNGYLSSRIDGLANFRTSNFRRLIYPPYYSPERRVFEQWNNFGLSIRNPRFAQSNYVNILRSKYKVRPVLKSETRNLPNGTIQGVVLDEAGRGMQGVRTVVAGTVRGKMTDDQGKFELMANPGQSVYLSFLGYENFRFEIGKDNYFEIALTPDYQDVGEVVVVGYGDQEKKEIMLLEIPDEEVLEEEIGIDLDLALSLGANTADTRLGYTVYNDSNGQPGAGTSIRLRGTSTFGADSSPLVIVDGVHNASIENIDPNQVASVETLNAEKAQALYGISGADGAIIVTTKRELARQNALLAQVKARTNLKETAFFFPQLKTNEEGEVSFEFESPESLTRWKLQLLAHNKTLASALMRQTVVTQKDLMVLPNAPRFVREGDQLTFSAKIASLSADTLKGFARLELFDAVTEKPVQSVVQSPLSNPILVISPKGNVEVNWQLYIPEGLQALRYRIVAVAGDFSDGEENVMPVLSNRMLVHESQPLWVNAKTSKTVSLNKLKNQQSKTLKHHRLSLHVTTNPVWEAIRSLPYLMEYPYECTEQTFARVYANSLGRHILDEQPAIQQVFERWKASGALLSKLEQNKELKALLIEETPWLREAQSETEQQKRLAALFDAEKLAAGLDSSLDKLREMQMSSGGFPWFAGSIYDNRYITQHIVAGLLHLAQFTGAEAFEDITTRGLSYMQKELAEDYQKLKKRENFSPAEDHIYFTQIQYLYAQSLAGSKGKSRNHDEAFAFYKKQAYEYWPRKGLAAQAMVAIFAYDEGDSVQAKTIMASLKEFAIENDELGNYWKSNTAGWFNWQAPIETHALLIEAFHKVDNDEVFVNGLRKWLLNHKRTNSWPTTKATTSAVNALLAFGPDWTGPNDRVWVKAGRKRLLPIKRSKNHQEDGTGYMKKIWKADEVSPALGTVKIKNRGKTQVWGGLHWQYFEDLDRITSSMGPLSAQKQLFKVEQTATGEQLQTITENSPLNLGDLVRVRIVLKTDRVMEFIHLKDMRASGFEPVNVLSEYHWRDGLGYYESTRDAATNFFIEYMPKGTYVFEYDLRANNAGSFSNGITSIQNMYAPEFSSHTEGIRVKIGK